MGAVSPAARETCRITPVRMPLIELGSTIVRIVCQREAPRFQQASRNDIGTAASASRVLVMITGSVITANVQLAASTLRPMPAEQNERAHAEQRMHDARHAGQVHHRQIHDAREPVVARVLVEVHAGQYTPRGRDQQRNRHQEERAHQRRPHAARRHVAPAGSG